MCYRNVFSCLILVCSFVTSCIASATIRDYYAEPGLTPFKTDINEGINESVDPFSGGLQLSFTDLFIPGNGGMDIAINRIYNPVQFENMPLQTVYGLGWTMHFGRVLISEGYFDRACNQQVYSVFTADNPSVEFANGAREILVLNTNDRDGSLVTRSGWRATCSNAGNKSFILTAPDGKKFYMDAYDLQDEVVSWYTTRIEDLHGNAIEIDYNTNTDNVIYINSISRSEEGINSALVTFSYRDVGSDEINLESISANGQTWTYEQEPIPNHTTTRVKQLRRVERPDGSEWAFNYYERLPDPEPDDSFVIGGPGSYVLQRVTHPYGATVDYTYQHVDFDMGPANDAFRPPEVTTALATKTLTLTGHDPYLWTYVFRPQNVPFDSNDPNFLRYDQTIVTGPESRVEYLHYGKTWSFDNSTFTYSHLKPSFLGLLREKSVYSLESELLETTNYEWSAVQISEENFWHGAQYRSEWWRDDATYLPVLVGEFRRRDSDISLPDGQFSSVVNYYDHDRFGNPTRVIESSNVDYNTIGPQHKQTTYEYTHDLTNWVLGNVALERVESVESIDGTNPVLIGEISRSFNDEGLLERETNFGVTTEYRYTSDGDLERITDPLIRNTTYSNYSKGIPQRIDYPDGTFEERTVTNRGTVEAETNARGNTKRYSYDLLNRLTGIIFPANAPVTIEYLESSRVLTRSTYSQTDTLDELGRITESLKGGIRFQTHYDALNRVIFESYPNSSDGITTNYDALGRKASVAYSNGDSIFYAYDDNETTITNARNIDTHYVYRYYGNDESNSTLIQVNSPENISTLWTKNLLNQSLSIIQGESIGEQISGFSKTYEYDEQHYLVSQTEPETGTTTFENDVIGRVLRSAVNGLPETVFSYDAADRITYIDYPDSTKDISYTYLENGLVDTVSRDSVVWDYDYDMNDNLTQEELSIQFPYSKSFTIEYDVNELDYTQSVTYPSGLELQLGPDALGRPTQVGTFASSISFHPSGAVQSYAAENGVVTTIGLNQRLYPETIQTTGLVDLFYNYDASGNIIEIQNHIDPTQSVSMLAADSYDGLDRLITADGPWGTSRYRYDALGNLMEKTESLEETYAYNGQLQLVGVGAEGQLKAYGYDLQGNINSKTFHTLNDVGEIIRSDVTNYRYNRANQLIRAQTPSTTKVFNYDGFGMRYFEREGVGYDINLSVYNKNGSLIYEESLKDCSATDHIYLSSLEIAKSTVAVADPSVDGDGDQIRDCLEVSLGLDPTNAGDAAEDIDGDGLSNLEEVQAGTSLILADTDGDGLGDREEILVHFTDAFSSDSDFDGVSDGVEIAQGWNPNGGSEGSEDADGDGLSNAIEQNIGSDMFSADTDGDGLSDSFEYQFWADANYDHSGGADSDGDGLTDLEEQTLGTSPISIDTDADGLPDNVEVTAGWNPTQVGEELLDEDNDRLLNAEEYRLGLDLFNPDMDGDTLLDGFEVAYRFDPLVVDDPTLDSDGDGLSSFDEQNAFANPHAVDTDLDALLDADEVRRYLTRADMADSDGDGIEDGQEVLFDGTDPNDASDFVASPLPTPLPISYPSNGQFALQLTDGDGEAWHIRSDGAFSWPNNTITHSHSHRFSSTSYVLSSGESELKFPLFLDGFTENNEREIVTQEIGYNYLRYKRKVYVSDEGGFVRYLEIIANPTDEARQVRLTIEGYYDRPSGSNAPAYIETSNGDTTFSSSDNFILYDDVSGTSGSEAFAYVISGENAPDIEPSLVGLQSSFRGGGRYSTRIMQRYELDIPPGGTQIVMHFISRSLNRETTITNARLLESLTTEAVEGMTHFERRNVVNFEAYDFIDSDGDGLRDFFEGEIGTDPQVADSDGDGLTDGFEYNFDLDYLVPGDEILDGDADGLTNIEEQAANTHPNEWDSDSDGLPDGQEVHTYFSDPARADSDSDGVDDYQEILEDKTDPLNFLDSTRTHEQLWEAPPAYSNSGDLWRSSIYGWNRVISGAWEICRKDRVVLSGPIQSFVEGQGSEVVFKSMLDAWPEISFTSKAFLSKRHNFVRHVFFYTNTSTDPVSFPIQQNCYFNAVTRQLVETGSGDLSITIEDDYYITSALGSDGERIEAYIMKDSAADESPINVFGGSDMFLDYSLVLAPGETKALMTFSVEQDTIEAARSKVDLIRALSVDALKGLTPTEKRQIVNFNVASIDRDADGLSDEVEGILGSNPLAADTDNDGIADGLEQEWNLNLLNASDATTDSDGDLLSNLEEVQAGADPFLEDTDNDGLDDYSEVMTFLTEPGNRDTDGGGRTDGDEVNIDSTIPTLESDDIQQFIDVSGITTGVADASGYVWNRDTAHRFSVRGDEWIYEHPIQNSVSEVRRYTVSKEYGFKRTITTYTNTASELRHVSASVGSCGLSGNGNFSAQYSHQYYFQPDDMFGYAIDSVSDRTSCAVVFSDNQESSSANFGSRDVVHFNIELQPGESKSVMQIHFGDRPASLIDSEIEDIIIEPGVATLYLTSAELESIINFNLSDGFDTDRDGVRNDRELELGLNPNNPDTDSDGLDDGYELKYSLTPLTPDDPASDSDGDGLDLATEYANSTSPFAIDSDFDGIRDFEELRTLNSNPASRYSDHGPLSDGIEWDVFGTDLNFPGDDRFILENEMSHLGGIGSDSPSVDSILEVGGGRYIDFPEQINNGNGQGFGNYAYFDQIQYGIEVYSPPNEEFYRKRHILRNISGQDKSITVELLGVEHSGTRPLRLMVSTSSGDAQVGDSDRWFVTRNWTGSNPSFFLQMMASENPVAQVNRVFWDDLIGGDAYISTSFTFDIPAGQSRSLLHLIARAESEAEINSKLIRLQNFDGYLLAELTEQERSEIVNFDVEELRADADGDGATDIYENLHGLDENVADTDGDGLLDGYELRISSLDPLVADDATLDDDGDGLTLLQESVAGTNPFDSDTDNDQLNDAEEVITYFTNPLLRDTDNGGVSDFQELTLDLTDPLVSNDDIVSSNPYSRRLSASGFEWFYNSSLFYPEIYSAGSELHVGDWRVEDKSEYVLDLSGGPYQGLNIRRKFYFDGDYMRVLEMLENPTESDIQYLHRNERVLKPSPEHVLEFYNGSGYFVSTYNSGSNNLITNFYGAVWRQDESNLGSGFLAFNTEFHNNYFVTVPAQDSVAIMHYDIFAVNRENAEALAQSLVSLDPESLRGMSDFERSRVINFDLSSTINNAQPTITIASPSEGQTFIFGSSVSLSATATDNEDGDLTSSISWSSNLDGALGHASDFSVNTLSVGVHEIAASVTDSFNVVGTATVTITINETPNSSPSVAIMEPADASVFEFGELITFTGSAIDEEDGELSGSMTWSSDRDGVLSSGPSFNFSSLSVGTHVIRAHVRDTRDAEDTATITIQISAPANTAPAVTITSPADGSEFAEGESVGFLAFASDAEDGDVSSAITWRSNIDGVIPGAGGSISISSLSVGNHVITATVLDSLNEPDSDTLSLTIVARVNEPPVISLLSPTEGESFIFGSAVNLSASASDTEDGDLSENISWSSDLDGVLFEGANRSISNLSIGTHEIAAVVTDSESDEDRVTVNITIVAANTSPVVTISEPSQGQTFDIGERVTFIGTAMDTEEGDLSSVMNWSSDVDGQIGIGSSVSTTILSEGPHTITASISDGGGLPGTASVTIVISGSSSSQDIVLLDGMDIGNPGLAGSFTRDSATNSYTLQATGSDIWGWVDNFYYAYQTASGDIDVRAQVSSLNMVDEWGRAGLMMRNSLEASSLYAANMLSHSAGALFQYRVNDEAETSGTVLADYGVGDWVRLRKVGNSVTSYASFDGVAWLELGTETVNFGENFYIGLAAVSTNDAVYLNATVDHLSEVGSGQNSEPTVAISSPTEGSSHTHGTLIDLIASASDAEDGDLSSQITWVSSNDGELGRGANVPVSTLSLGGHTITASVTDADSANASSSVQITIAEDQDPVVSITTPADGTSFEQGENVQLSAIATDAEDGDLTSTIIWQSDIDGNLGEASMINHNSLSVGTHVISASVQDSASQIGSDQITLNITAHVNNGPTLLILSPTDGSAFTLGADITLSATATDAEDGDLSSVINWLSDIDGLLGTGGSFPVNTLSEGLHTLTAEVVDTQSEPASESVTISISAGSGGDPLLTQGSDVGSPSIAGSHEYSSATDTYTVRGSGIDIWGWVDSFYYVFGEYSGNYDVRVRVSSLVNGHEWSKAGVMFRGGTGTGDAYGATFISPGQGAWFQHRVEEVTETFGTQELGYGVNDWIRIEKAGDLVTSYVSHDGVAWTEIGSSTVMLGGTYYIGIAVSSIEDTMLTEAAFENLTIEERP